MYQSEPELAPFVFSKVPTPATALVPAISRGDFVITLTTP